MKTNGKTTTAATADNGITTGGEVFADGLMIELIGGAHLGNPPLMLWDSSTELMAPALEYNGQRYEPAEIERSVLQQLMLPTRCSPHGTTREFLAETCTVITNLVGLDEKSASLAARIVLCSAIIDAVSVAPVLVIAGPDTTRANRLVSVLRCLCRHSLPLTSVTPASFCSLANGARYTFLISQANIRGKLRSLLDDASRSDRKIPFRGRLLDLFGVQVIQSESVFADDPWPLRSIRIAMVPTGTALPAFDQDAQRLIATEFQAKLLSFRRANLGAAQRISFDTSKFSLGLRDLARSLAAATPDDIELQAEVFELLREEDAESRSARWIDLSAIAVEAVLVACRESPGKAVYVSELSNIAQALLNGRGEDSTIHAGAFGKRLKLLRFVVEPRDAQGKKLRLTEAVRDRALQLARDLDIPGQATESTEVTLHGVV
jgi:hypothetical protein